MIQIDPGGVMATIITVLLALLGLASWLGALAQKVKGHSKKIDENREEAQKCLERLHTENGEDHQKIFSKLEEVNLYLRNGKQK